MSTVPRTLRTALVSVVVLGVLALAGCGLRLATPMPTAPSPGPAEQVRARTVADALALAAAAGTATTSADATTSAVLGDVVTTSTAHVQALGGVYRSGLPTASASASPSGAAPSAPTAPTTPTALLAELAAATVTASVDADAVPDASLARVVAAVATARGELVRRLAAALGVPEPSTAVPSTATSATGAAATPTPAQPTGPSTSGAAASGTSASGATPSGTSTSGVPLTATTALVLAHDQAGYGLEVIAAQARGDLLGPALASAHLHRAAATALAQAGGIAGTAADPRRAQYLMPAGLADAAVARATAARLELAVADAYGTAIGATPAGQRATLLTGLRTAVAAAVGWGAAADPLPGLAERSGATTAPSGTPGPDETTSPPPSPSSGG